MVNLVGRNTIKNTTESSVEGRQGLILHIVFEYWLPLVRELRGDKERVRTA